MRKSLLTLFGLSSTLIAAAAACTVTTNSDNNGGTPDGGGVALPDSGGTPAADAGTDAADSGDTPDPDSGTGNNITQSACGTLAKNGEKKGTIEAAETWAAGEYDVTSSLSLKAPLTLSPCVTLRIAPGATINVQTGGALKLLGTSDHAVRITSANASPSAGDWGYIEFGAGSQSAANEIHFAIIEHGGKDYGTVYVASDASVAIDHTIIQESGTYGLQVVGGGHVRDFADNTITKSGSSPVKIHPNSVGDLLGGTFTGNASDVITVEGGQINKTATWKSLGVPFRSDSLTVAKSPANTPTTLTIEAGVTLQLRPDTTFLVQTDGALHLAGTAASPVKITSSETSPSAGDWRYIEFYNGSTGAENVIENAIIEYGGKDYGAVYLDDKASVKITNTTIQHSSEEGIQVVGADAKLRDFTGNTLTDNKLGSVVAQPNVIGQLGAGTYADPIHVSAGTLSADATWPDHGTPYVIDGGVTVQAPSGTATLTIGEGSKLALSNGLSFYVQNKGVLKLAGTAAKHVTITSASAAPVAGSWGYIDIESLGNTFTYADISYGGQGGYGQIYVGSNSSVALNDVVFTNGLTCDVDKASGTSSVTGNSTFNLCP